VLVLRRSLLLTLGYCRAGGGAGIMSLCDSYRLSSVGHCCWHRRLVPGGVRASIGSRPRSKQCLPSSSGACFDLCLCSGGISWSLLASQGWGGGCIMSLCDTCSLFVIQICGTVAGIGGGTKWHLDVIWAQVMVSARRKNLEVALTCVCAQEISCALSLGCRRAFWGGGYIICACQPCRARFTG
jgi:hypothetical protein